MDVALAHVSSKYLEALNKMRKLQAKHIALANVSSKYLEALNKSGTRGFVAAAALQHSRMGRISEVAPLRPVVGGERLTHCL